MKARSTKAVSKAVACQGGRVLVVNRETLFLSDDVGVLRPLNQDIKRRIGSAPFHCICVETGVPLSPQEFALRQ